jgi:hypothetical protein
VASVINLAVGLLLLRTGDARLRSRLRLMGDICWPIRMIAI